MAETPQPPEKAPHWVFALVGLVMVLVVIVVPLSKLRRQNRRLQNFIVCLLITGMAAIADWNAFAPGEHGGKGGAVSLRAPLRWSITVNTGSESPPSAAVKYIFAGIFDAAALLAWFLWLRRIGDFGRGSSRNQEKPPVG